MNEFKDKSELFAHLRQNKELYKRAKIAELKHADGVNCVPFSRFEPKQQTVKAFEMPTNQTETDANILKLSVVVNTTNIRDSHKDVHIPGIWKKSLQENKNIYLFQEHIMRFDKVIADKVNAFTQSFMWSQLGAPYVGLTEALVFNADAEKDLNPYMIDKYIKGKVKQHSVGMRYVQLFLAMKSDDRRDYTEREVWEKYASQVHNLSEFEEEEPYFWAVTEAKLIEGSSVILGSNSITPTMQVEQPKQITANDEPSHEDTQKNTGWEVFELQKLKFN